jgi:hypothetical protein
MTNSHISADNSTTAQALEHAQLYGYRPSQDEPDPRPMPSDETITKAVEDIFDILSFALSDSGLESDLNNVLWGTVNQFHHTAQRVARDLDRNEHAQRSAQSEQDGSEVKIGRARTPHRPRTLPLRTPRSPRNLADLAVRPSSPIPSLRGSPTQDRASTIATSHRQ